jgi:hypothetical protein
MNCVIYGTKCQYTPPWSPNSGRKKDPAAPSPSSSKPAPLPGGKKRSTSVATGERGSQSPGAFDSPDSPNSSLHDEAFLPSSSQALLPKMVNARRLAVGKSFVDGDDLTGADFLKNSSPSMDMDQVGHRLDQYATFLTNFSESQKSPIDILSDDTGLPPQPLANALLQGNARRRLFITDTPPAYADGLHAGGTLTAGGARMRPQLSSSNRRSRSLHEFTNSGGHADVSMADSLALGSLVTQAAGLAMSTPQHQHHHAPHSPMGYGPMDMGGEYGMPLQHHHQQMAEHQQQQQHAQQQQQQQQQQHHQHHRGVPQHPQQRGMPNGMPGQAPRSIPQGLGLAIGGPEQQQQQQQHQWASGPNSAPPMMPPGYPSHHFDML